MFLIDVLSETLSSFHRRSVTACDFQNAVECKYRRESRGERPTETASAVHAARFPYPLSLPPNVVIFRGVQYEEQSEEALNGCFGPLISASLIP